MNGVSGFPSFFVKIGTKFNATISHGSSSNYSVLEAGEHLYKIRDQEGGQLLMSGTLSLESGKSVSLLVSGEKGIFLTNRLYQDS